MKLFVIYGGQSAEHDISIMTAQNIINHVNYDKYTVQPIYITKAGEWLAAPLLTTGNIAESEQLRLSAGETASYDRPATGVVVTPLVVKEQDAVVFPVLHGPNGEDGTIQGLFEMLNMPYVGTNVLASACGMDKIISKKLFEMAGIPQLPYLEVFYKNWQNDAEQVLNNCEVALAYPMFVKPANMGSSVGISKAEDREQLAQAINEALRFDRRLVVEQGVIARELEVAVLGNDEIKTTAVGEIVKSVDFYDFEEKYVNQSVGLQIPADISEETSEILRAYAVDAYEALDACGLTRCDFFLAENGHIYINEVNTMPGFTPFSMYPKLWEHAGLPYGELIACLIDLAIARHAEKQRFQLTL